MYILDLTTEKIAINTPSAQTVASVYHFLPKKKKTKKKQAVLSDSDLGQEVGKVSLRYLVIPESKKSNSILLE